MKNLLKRIFNSTVNYKVGQLNPLFWYGFRKGLSLHTLAFGFFDSINHFYFRVLFNKVNMFVSLLLMAASIPLYLMLKNLYSGGALDLTLMLILIVIGLLNGLSLFFYIIFNINFEYKQEQKTLFGKKEKEPMYEMIGGPLIVSIGFYYIFAISQQEAVKGAAFIGSMYMFYANLLFWARLRKLDNDGNYFKN